MRLAIILAALVLIAGCGHGHSSNQDKPEPQMAPYLPPYEVPAPVSNG